MFSHILEMCVWIWLLWLLHIIWTDLSLSIVTQWPHVVEVTAGETVTLKCSVMELYSPCSSVAWFRTHLENMTLSNTDPSKVIVRSSSHGWTEVCSAVISSQTVRDSGMYYCMVVQSKFAHIGNGSRVIVKDPTVSPALEVIYPVRSGASIVPLQCLVTGLLPAQVTVYWVIDGKKVMGHTHSRWTHTINQVLLLAEEWKRQPACVCVVEYGKDTFNKTLQHRGPHDVCCVVKYLYASLAVVSSLLFLVMMVTGLVLCFKARRSTEVRGA